MGCEIWNKIKEGSNLVRKMIKGITRIQSEQYNRERARSEKIDTLIKRINNTETLYNMKKHCDLGKLEAFSCANLLTKDIYEYLQTLSSPRPAKEERIKVRSKNFTALCDNLAIQCAISEKDSFPELFKQYKLFERYKQLRKIYIDLLYDDLKRIKLQLQPSVHNDRQR